MSKCCTDGVLKKHKKCRRMEGIRNSGRQKEWHTVARTSLETEVQELSQKTKPVKPGSRVSVFRKKGGCGSLVENGGKKKSYNLV